MDCINWLLSSLNSCWRWPMGGTSKGLEIRSRLKSGYLFSCLPLCEVSAVWLSPSRRIYLRPQTFLKVIFYSYSYSFWVLVTAPSSWPFRYKGGQISLGCLHHPLLVSLNPDHMVVNSPVIKLPSESLFECAIGFLLDP